MLFIKINLIMKLNVLQIIYFCLINYANTFPNDLFDELWETNQSEPQANNNPIESQPKIKVEPHEEQFDGRWQDESALKGIVKVEQGSHFGAVKVEGKDKIKHEFEWRDEESGKIKEQLEDHVKEEDQDGQAPNTSDHKNIGDDDEYWSEDEDHTASSADDIDQDNSKEVKHLSDQNNSTDQDESVDGQQNESNKCEKIESDQQKRYIIQKFREIKEDYKKNRKFSTNEWAQIEIKISNGLGVYRSKIYKWIKQFDLRKETKSKFSEFEKRQIIQKFREMKEDYKKKRKYSKNEWNKLDTKISNGLGIGCSTIYKWIKELGLNQEKFSELEKCEILKQFDKIKNKCNQAKLKNFSKNELEDKISKKLGVCRRTIYEWKREFGLSASKKISDATKIGILKKYAKIKVKNPKMSNCAIAALLKISISSLNKWKAKFREETKHF